MFSQFTIHLRKLTAAGAFLSLNICLYSHSGYAEQAQSEQQLLKPLL
jgi:hypothetical protein